MVELNIKNLLSVPNALKIPECILAFITMMIANARLSDYDDQPVWILTLASYDSINLGAATLFGFFLISLIQLISIILGDKSPSQDFLFALCGFFFYIAIGSKMIHTLLDVEEPDLLPKMAMMRACGAMAIITSFVHFIDLIFSGLRLKNGTN